MTISEQEARNYLQEGAERQRDLFMRAADLSHGPYDSVEDRRERLAVAVRLADTMQPGEPVIHRASTLRVVGGHLTERPRVIETTHGDLAIGYQLQTNDQIVTGSIAFNHMIPGIRPGWNKKQYDSLPTLVAGDDDIKGYVWDHYVALRIQEHQLNGVPWDSMEPLMELRTIAALRHTDIRMRHILPPAEAGRLKERLYADFHAVPGLQDLIAQAYLAV